MGGEGEYIFNIDTLQSLSGTPSIWKSATSLQELN